MVYRLVYGVQAGVWCTCMCIGWCMVYRCIGWCIVYRLVYGVQAGVWCTG